MLKKEKNYSHVSTGDLLRDEVRKGSELGIKIKAIIDEGGLVDDMTVLDLFKNNLSLNDDNYVLDGFPRTLNQCKLLDEHLFSGIDYKVIYFEIDERKVIDRIVNRRIALKSGKIYNLLTDPPQNPGVCDVSGEPLVHRDDDKAEVVKRRLLLYKEGIQSILDYYSKSLKLLTVNASDAPGNVYDGILKIIG
jgi:adenylate kinase